MIDSTSADCCVFAKESMTVEGYMTSPPAVHQRTNSQLKDHKEFLKKSKDSLLSRSVKELSLLQFHEVEPHLQSNPYITSGYRASLSTKMCIESAFWLTNETINIWSHVFGWMLFFGLTIYDLLLLNIHASPFDKLVVGLLLGCFQISMASSTMYHTFSCKSEKHFNCFLSFDLFGIALSLLGIYLSGIYYAFWCHPVHRMFYLSTVFFIFVTVMGLQLPKLKASDNLKMISFVCWAAYGVIPTCHWVIIMGGWENPIVAKLLSRILNMYLISGLAFLIYVTRMPERFFKGKLDYIGSSHQWWHFLVVIALYYWHNTGILYIEYRMNHGCVNDLRL
ncbi:progestin and adipoQ receptor family member 3-like [Metopolophium dirhodum]|uniref:progestin and adipoQ receptor family member 3-like n=1 Tax=Metopolophium dirhodum TaxID=44670 RepID=UPI00298FF35E|nr:progestin and adipoQ receptor family member 3-like [Metopolophium dirhodum]